MQKLHKKKKASDSYVDSIIEDADTVCREATELWNMDIAVKAQAKASVFEQQHQITGQSACRPPPSPWDQIILFASAAVAVGPGNPSGVHHYCHGAG